MIRLMICDDEWIVREGILQVAGQIPELEMIAASSGAEALELYRMSSIDGLLLDICMPGMTGLELMRELNEEKSNDPTIIIMSGYDDFEYVREAMTLGASDYLLKPIMPELLKETIYRMMEEIKRKQALYFETEKLRLESEKLRPILRTRLFYDILNGETTKNYTDNILKLFRIPEKANQFRLLVGEISLGNSSLLLDEEEQTLRLFAISKMLEEELTSLCPERVFILTATKIAILILEEEKNVLIDELEEIIKRCKREYKALLRVGVGRTVGLLHLRYSFNDAADAIRMLLEKPGEVSDILYIEDIKEKSERFSLQNEGEILRSRIRRGEIFGVVEVLERLFVDGSQYQDVELDSAALLCTSLITDALTLIEETGGTLKEYYEKNNGSPLMALTTCHTIEMLKTKTVDELQKIATELRGRAKRKNYRIIERARTIMEEQYAENIGVKEIADLLSLSKNYFGQLFKSETGMTVNEYLNTVRINQAKSLLKNSMLKVYEVAYKVGFSDHFYFSSVFKKQTGVSPSEYRDL